MSLFDARNSQLEIQKFIQFVKLKQKQIFITNVFTPNDLKPENNILCTYIGENTYTWWYINSLYL